MVEYGRQHVKGTAMKHLSTISRVSMPAQGETTALESIILLLVSVFFYDWQNYQSVVQNLSKFYRKT